MSSRIYIFFLFLAICLFSCQPDEAESPLVGAWEWSSGSRKILPSGFESWNRDRSSTYLVGDAEYIFIFDQDGTFESTFTPPGKSTSLIQGSWILEEDLLNLDVTEPQNFEGISQYNVPFYDNSNLDLQWSVQYLEFSDAQYKKWGNNGFWVPDVGWTVDRDSLLTSSGTLITSVITLHFEKK